MRLLSKYISEIFWYKTLSLFCKSAAYFFSLSISIISPGNTKISSELLRVFPRLIAVAVIFSLLLDVIKAILFKAFCFNTAPPFKRAFSDIPLGFPTTLNGLKTAPLQKFP